MNNNKTEKRYHINDRRTSNSVVNHIFYLMLEFIFIGMLLKLIYTIDILIFNETVAFIMMVAFGLWSLNYIRISTLPGFKIVLDRDKK